MVFGLFAVIGSVLDWVGRDDRSGGNGSSRPGWSDPIIGGGLGGCPEQSRRPPPGGVGRVTPVVHAVRGGEQKKGVRHGVRRKLRGGVADRGRCTLDVSNEGPRAARGDAPAGTRSG